MAFRTVFWLAVTLLVVVLTPQATGAQGKFSALRSVHFDVYYMQQVAEVEAQRVLQFLQTDYDSLKNQLGLEPQSKLEVRLYDSPAPFRTEINMGRDVLPAMYVHGVLHVLEPAPPGGLDNALRYQLARVFLEPVGQHSCPRWLTEASAIYHSGRMRDLSSPASVTLSSFSDLSQDLEEATTPVERTDLDFILGRTMQFLIEKYGEQKAFSVFKEFATMPSVETVFKKVFAEDFQNTEKAWAKYVAVRPRKQR